MLAVGALFLPAVPVRAADVSVDFFYDNLNGGSWYEVADYGYVWQPDVASNPDWRPYTDGYWAYTDVGWTWVSYEDFGWATYHYGRWVRLADRGWGWVPGYEWGPAWVSWRTGGDYVDWAPLPPAGGGGEIVYEGRPITGQVDLEFDIGPAYYNFIDVRYIGEPVLRDRIFGYDRNVTIIENTVNVTNITYNNSIVYNYGPDFGVVSRYSVRPIQRLTIQRESIDPLQAVKMGNVTKVQGNKLILGAPMKLQKGNAQLAPKLVKEKIAQPKIEKGWANISDPNAKVRLQQKFKTENAQNVPKPTFQPKAGADLSAGAPGAAVGAAASPGASPFERGKGKHKGEKFENQPGASIAPGTSPAASMTPFEPGKGKKGKGQGFENQASVAPAASPASSMTPFEEGKGRHKDQKFENQPGVSGAPGTAPTEATTPFDQGKGKHKGEKHEGNVMPTPNAMLNPNGPPPQQGNEGRHQGPPKYDEFQAGTQGHGSGGGAGKQHDQQLQRGQQIQQQQQGNAQQQGNVQGQDKGKKNKGEGSPSPPPQ